MSLRLFTIAVFAIAVCGLMIFFLQNHVSHAQFDVLLDIFTNGVELIGIGWGLCYLFLAARSCIRRERFMRRTLLGLLVATIGLATPGIINWVVADCRCGDTFS